MRVRSLNSLLRAAPAPFLRGQQGCPPLVWCVALAVCLSAGRSLAQPDGAAAPPLDPATETPAPGETSTTPGETAEAPREKPQGPAPPLPSQPSAEGPADRERDVRLRALAQQNDELREELQSIRDDQRWLKERLDQQSASPRISGYVDFGFFYVQGDGRGIRSDFGHERYPEYEGIVPESWVFLGDPLSTAINSRGDPADVAESRAITFDPIGNGGKASFILNNLNLQLFAGIGENLTIDGMVDFVPRSRDVSNPDGAALGDYVDVRLGYVEYRVPAESLRLSIFAGKFDSVLGYEYRIQEAPDRISVTPSLICRYTCGHPLGVKARLRLFDDAFTLATSVTNGSHFVESFPFHDEIDSNHMKTVAGRVSYRFPLGAGLEIGASGAYGAQDVQTDEAVRQWHAGADLHLEWADFDFTAEYVQGRAEGATEPGGPECGLSPCLRYEGGYALLGYRITNWLMPYVRGDFRDALHRSGASFVYVSELARGTGGIRMEFGPSIVIKAEYTVNRELGRIPQFPNDVFTSSMVARF